MKPEVVAEWRRKYTDVAKSVKQLEEQLNLSNLNDEKNRNNIGEELYGLSQWISYALDVSRDKLLGLPQIFVKPLNNLQDRISQLNEKIYEFNPMEASA